MLLRAIVVWFAMMALAIANGAFREAALVPALGTAAAHVASTLLLGLLIAGLTWLTIGWIGPGSSSQAMLIGAVWLLLTLGFEFGFGRLVAGKSWGELLADYNILAGRVWVLIPLLVLFAPYLMARRRALF